VKVLLGNTHPYSGKNEDGTPKLADLGGAPVVTEVRVPDADEDGLGGYSFDPTVDVHELQNHLYRTRNTGITKREKDEALLAFVHDSGAWASHSAADAPSWVAADDPAFADVLAAFYNCPNIGDTATAEAAANSTHWTRWGEPGSLPTPAGSDIKNLLTQTGRNILDASFLGGGQLGYAGTATATGTASLTATGTPWTASAYIGMVVVASAGAYGVILSNTTSVLTIDRWYTLATPGGSAASTPSGTTTFVIVNGGAFAMFMGLSNTNITPAVTDTTMTGEITTASGGLIRKIYTWAHSAGTTTTTATGVFTVNGSDTIPVTVYAMNISTSLLTGSTVTMAYETSLSASATLSAIGDQLTVTETITSA
jgi:hypothetical protein